MGYLQSANTIVRNTQNALDKILQSGSAISITGLGEPVLVTWYNINDKLSTVTAGIETVDALLGPDSPFRMNRVENLPVYGIAKDIQNLEMHLDDNGIMDMDWQIEPVIPPNTIKPCPYDHMVVEFATGRKATFRINDVQMSTLRESGFYKIPMHLVDLDSEEYINQLERITVKEKEVILENVGTNEQCIVSSKSAKTVKQLTNLLGQAISDYIDTFFNHKYNSFIYRGYCNGKYIIYDPYLTKFLLNHDLLDFYNEILQPVVIDQDETFRMDYNKTVFRAIEMRERKRIKPLLYDVTDFSRKRTNPFSYWGEEVVYQVHVYEDVDTRYPKNNYMDFNWLYNIKTIKESNSVTMFENLIIRFFQQPTFENFLHPNDLKQLEDLLYEPTYSETYFYLVPIVLYILATYKDYLISSDL